MLLSNSGQLVSMPVSVILYKGILIFLSVGVLTVSIMTLQPELRRFDHKASPQPTAKLRAKLQSSHLFANRFSRISPPPIDGDFFSGILDSLYNMKMKK